MADDLLTEIRAELRRRLEESRAAVHEYERLQAALVALDAQEAREAARDNSTARRTTRRSSPKARRKRAPAGENRAGVLRVVGERPGVSAGELASAASVNRTTLHALLRRMIDAGEIDKQDLPGGRTGYRLAASSESSSGES